MRPKSLPLTITGVLAIALGTALIGVGIGLPDWTETTLPTAARKNVGLFEECVEGQGCDSREDESDEVHIVAGLSLGGGFAGLLSFIMGVIMLFMFLAKKLSCVKLLPWITLLWSLVSGGAIIAALVVFEEEEYSDPDGYDHLGVSFALTAAGGGFVVIGGVMSSIGGYYLLSYLKRLRAKEEQILPTSKSEAVYVSE